MTKEMDAHDFVMTYFPRRFYQPENWGTRTKEEYPYSYSPFIVWGNENPDAKCVYSDRMHQWHGDKYDALYKKHLNVKNDLGAQAPKKVESFLAEYFDKPNLKLYMIVEWCNVANGYAYWSFYYTD